MRRARHRLDGTVERRDIVFLGTGASEPDRDRSPSALLMRSGTTGLLVDCGEGAQRRCLQVGSDPARLDAVLLTHLHADHVLGLPGLLKGASLGGRSASFLVAGPTGTAELIGAIRQIVGRIGFPIEIREHGPSATCRVGNVRIDALPADHHGVPALGYRISFPAVSGSAPVAVVSGDTAPSPTLITAAHGAELLIHEATYLTADGARADAEGHSTAAAAARAGSAAHVQMLALVHVRAHPDAVLREARAFSESVVVPNDLDRVDLDSVNPRFVAGPRRHGRTGTSRNACR